VGELESLVEDHNRKAEEATRADERFRSIFNHSNDGILLVDPARDEILDVNAKACRMLGYSREELLALPMSAIHPHELVRFRAFAQSVHESGEGWTDELSCATKSGGVLSAEISAAMLDVDGRRCLIALVRDTSDRTRLLREQKYLLGEIRTEGRFGSIIGESPALKRVLQQIEMVAPTDASVLIVGESGTGKELVARAIHENSRRNARPLVRVNCPAIPNELFESEFFGHVKGAFTGAGQDRVGRFELADGGTLFLDEIGEIPPRMQSKLLRVLQEGQFERVGESRTRKVDVRIIAATNKDLLRESEAGRFRQDLYYRLCVFPIGIPPLRDRKEDIRPLALHLSRQSCQRLKVPTIRLTREDLRLLELYDWPGNVRELQNVIERAVIVSRSGALRFDLPPTVPPTPDDDNLVPGSMDAIVSDAEMKRRERKNLLAALERTGWKIFGPDGAAMLLGIKPTTLASRIKTMDLKKAD